MDTVCFQGEQDLLADRQRQEWGPLREWFESEYNVKLGVATGLASPNHPEETILRVTEQLLSRDIWELCALEIATQTAKSFIVASALVDRETCLAEEAIRLAQLEEDFQVERWGMVEGDHDVTESEMLKRRWSSLALLALIAASALLLQGDVFSVPRLARLKGSSSAEEVAEVLIRDGVVLLERNDAETVRAAFKELEEGRMGDGQSVRYGESTQLLKRPLDPQKELHLRRLAEDPIITAAAELARQRHGEGSDHGIAWEVRLLILSSGMPEGDMHRDVVDTSSIPLKRPLQWGLNTIWAVDDFTAENGATRFVPGSHSSSAAQGFWLGGLPEATAHAKAATMAAGSVVIYYASTLHGSGENRSPQRRAGLNFNYAFVDELGQRPLGWGY
ncbi:ATP synthase mitochondrial F1 complex assembly factor 2 [Durusdinium trenchii]|uniref:ATP synthase mitochondrial F1 complex assembly factor 2 n=1 Tax=Durusdinium trenchii TaxID=1381693 RepID=A0ABP0SCQ8_9DINO